MEFPYFFPKKALALSLNMFEYEYISILNVCALKQENRDFALLQSL